MINVQYFLQFIYIIYYSHPISINQMDSRTSSQKRQRTRKDQMKQSSSEEQAAPVRESSLQLIFRIIIAFQTLYEYLKQLFCQTFNSQFWKHLQQQDYNECYKTIDIYTLQDVYLKTRKQSGARKLQLIQCLYYKNQHKKTIKLISYYLNSKYIIQIQVQNQMQLIRLICNYMNGNMNAYTSQMITVDMKPLDKLIAKIKNNSSYKNSNIQKRLKFYRQIMTRNKCYYNKDKIHEVIERQILPLQRYLQFSAYTKKQIKQQIMAQLIPTKWLEKIINYAKSKDKIKQSFPPPLTYFEVAFIDISKQNEQILHIFKQSKFVWIPKHKIDILLECFQGICLSQSASRNKMHEKIFEKISSNKQIFSPSQLKRQSQQKKNISPYVNRFGFNNSITLPWNWNFFGNKVGHNDKEMESHKSQYIVNEQKTFDIIDGVKNNSEIMFNQDKKGHSQNQIGNRYSKEQIMPRGLENLGNTCYMNSGLQCLHKTKLLSQNIKSLKTLKQFPDPQYLRQYKQLIQQLDFKNIHPFKPKALKQLIGEKNFLFEGYEQHDSCELVSSVINNLHEALNNVVKKQIIPIDKTQKNQKRLYENYKKRDEMRMRSVIDDIFIGRFRTSYQCLTCSEELVLFQKFNVMYLPIPTVPFDKYHSSTFTLRECMRQFQKIDVMEGNKSWHCNQCNSKQPTDRKMRIYATSKILIFCFKRFDENRKINPMIEYPLELDLGSLSLQNKEIQGKRYSLYGVINHIGSLSSGHYKAYCREQNDNWFEFNDACTSPIQKDQVKSRNAYVLFYELMEK